MHPDRLTHPLRNSVFEVWHDASRPSLDPNEKRPAYLARFRAMLPQVTIIPGQSDTLAEAEVRARGLSLPEIPDAPHGWQVLAAVLRELQRAVKDASFFISTRDAARIAGRTHAMEGLRDLEALAAFGVIVRERRGEAKSSGRKASTYRYLLPV